MPYMSWDESYNIGIDIIDAQHKRIVDYINMLDEAIRTKDDRVVKQVIDELVDYTKTHFKFEEGLLQKSGYPHFDMHKLVHVSFSAGIGKCVERFNNGEDVSQKLLSDLRAWLSNHIKRDDIDYAPYVRKFIAEEHGEGWLRKRLKAMLG